MRTLLLLAPLLASSLLANTAWAQTLRCESADGKVTYANGSCPNGTTLKRSLPAPTSPDQQDVKAAQERARNDQQQAQRLDKQARTEEAQRQKQQAAAAQKAQVQERNCRKLSAKVKDLEEQVSRAVLSKRAPLEKRLSKARQDHAAECG